MNPMRGVGVGADVIERNHFDAPLELVRRLERRAGLLARGLRHVRAVAFLATLLEQRFAARGLVAIDGAEDFLGPARRPQQLQRVLDAHAGRRCPPSCGSALRAATARACRCSSGAMAPTPSASPTLRASGCATEPLYCTQSNFQMFHTYG